MFTLHMYGVKESLWVVKSIINYLCETTRRVSKRISLLSFQTSKYIMEIHHVGIFHMTNNTFIYLRNVTQTLIIICMK